MSQKKPANISPKAQSGGERKAESGKRKAESPMRMQPLRDRTKQFAMRVVRVYAALPTTTLAQTIGRQMLRSGTSVAANFREASRARSDAEFIAKLGIVEQELDETLLWLELLVESNVVSSAKLGALQKEADELLRIVVTSIQRTKRPVAKPKAESRLSAFRSRL